MLGPAGILGARSLIIHGLSDTLVHIWFVPYLFRGFPFPFLRRALQGAYMVSLCALFLEIPPALASP